jgi:hypothetical protein
VIPSCEDARTLDHCGALARVAAVRADRFPLMDTRFNSDLVDSSEPKEICRVANGGFTIRMGDLNSRVELWRAKKFRGIAQLVERLVRNELLLITLTYPHLLLSVLS